MSIILALLGFLYGIINLLNVLVFMELFWVSIFIYFSLKSQEYDSMILFLIGVYSLCLATAETCVGLALIMTKVSFSSLVTLEDDNFYYLLRNKLANFMNDKVV